MTDHPAEGATLPDKQSSADGNWLWLIINLVGVLAVLVGTFWLHQPPPPLPADAPENLFSASRADIFLKDLVGDAIPHPAGSAQNKVVRERIVRHLENMGYEVQLHESTARTRVRRLDQEPDQLPLVNILCRIKGTSDDPPVMLAAHYDSVPYGPGACDDAVAVASILEIARMLQNGNPPMRDIVLLISDGEEYGLLGAAKFVDEHPWANEIDVAINLEARGTSGPSLMFETSPDSLSLIPHFAAALKQPMANSLSYEIYKLLPNDTDFTEFKRGGIRGFNFGFIADVKNYHTENDNYETADRSSFQHHGQNAWQLLQRFAFRAAETPVTGQAVYFDLFGRVMIWWPAPWSTWLSLAGLIACLFSATIAVRRQHLSWRLLATNLGITLSTFGLTLLLGWLCDWALQLDGRLDQAWPDQPVPLLLSFWSLGLTCAIGMTLIARCCVDAHAANLSVTVLWLVAALAAALAFSGGSYLVLVPAICAIVARLLFVDLFGNRQGAASTVSVLATCLIWLPNESQFYDALGFALNLLLIFRVGLLMTVCLPLFALIDARCRWYCFWVSLAMTIALFLATVWTIPSQA